MGAIALLLTLVLWLFVIAILVRVAFSWVTPNASNSAARLAFVITEPVLGPVRRRLPPVSGFDLSPLVVTVACYFLINALSYAR